MYQLAKTTEEIESCCTARNGLSAVLFILFALGITQFVLIVISC